VGPTPLGTVRENAVVVGELVIFAAVGELVIFAVVGESVIFAVVEE
jgi:hypothetical protein